MDERDANVFVCILITHSGSGCVHQMMNESKTTTVNFILRYSLQLGCDCVIVCVCVCVCVNSINGWRVRAVQKEIGREHVNSLEADFFGKHSAAHLILQTVIIHAYT